MDTTIPNNHLMQSYRLGVMFEKLNTFLSHPDRNERTFTHWIIGGRLFNDLNQTFTWRDTQYTILVYPINKEHWHYQLMQKVDINYDRILIDASIGRDPWSMGNELRSFPFWRKLYEVLLNMNWNRFSLNPKLRTKERIEFQIPYKKRPNTHIVGPIGVPITYHD